MNRNASILTTAFLFVAIAVFAWAGPLNPPSGNIEPTNLTLQEIADKIDSVLAVQSLTSDIVNSWSYAGRINTVQDTTPEVLIPAGLSGILHAVVIGGVSQQGNIALFEGDGVTQIGEYAAPASSTAKVVLNIRFTNGIAARRDNIVTGYTILYRLD